MCYNSSSHSLRQMGLETCIDLIATVEERLLVRQAETRLSGVPMSSIESRSPPSAPDSTDPFLSFQRSDWRWSCCHGEVNEPASEQRGGHPLSTLKKG